MNYRQPRNCLTEKGEFSYAPSHGQALQLISTQKKRVERAKCFMI
jgi:hypothetical protein